MATQLDFQDPYSSKKVAPQPKIKLDFDDPFAQAPTTSSNSQPAAEPKPVGFVDAAVRGFKRSLPETKSLAYGAVAAGAGALGADKVRDWGLKNYQRVQHEEVDPLGSNASLVGTLEGKNSIGEYVGDTLGNLGWQALQSAAVGAAGAVAGGATGAPAGGIGALPGAIVGGVGGLVARGAVKKTINTAVKDLVEDQIAKGVARDVAEQAGQQVMRRRLGQIGGGALAATGLNAAQEVGIGYTGRAEDAQKNGEQLTQGDALRAIGWGVPAGLVDTAAEGLNVGRLLGGASESPKLLRRVLAGAAEGAATEGGTEAVQAAMERAGAGQNVTGSDAYLDYLENFAAGALGGGVIGGASGYRRKLPNAPKDEGDVKAPPAGEPLALPPPDPIVVGPDGEAITPEQQRQRDDIGLTPDVLRAQQQAQARQPIDAEYSVVGAPQLPSPGGLDQTVDVDSTGEAMLPGQRAQRRQEDAQFAAQRAELGLTPDVNAARTAHPSAVPNTLPNGAPLPDPAKGPLSNAVNVAHGNGALQQAAQPLALAAPVQEPIVGDASGRLVTPEQQRNLNEMGLTPDVVRAQRAATMRESIAQQDEPSLRERLSQLRQLSERATAIQYREREEIERELRRRANTQGTADATATGRPGTGRIDAPTEPVDAGGAASTGVPVAQPAAAGTAPATTAAAPVERAQVDAVAPVSAASQVPQGVQSAGASAPMLRDTPASGGAQSGSALPAPIAAQAPAPPAGGQTYDLPAVVRKTDAVNALRKHAGMNTRQAEDAYRAIDLAGAKPGTRPRAGVVAAIESARAGSAKAASGQAETLAAQGSAVGSEADSGQAGMASFAPETGTLGIPRADMPQVPAKSHGGLVKHLNAQGIGHETTMVDAGSLKPTQAEYSPEKVEQAKSAKGDRAVIVSSDGHIIDGHHQAVAAAQEGKPVKAIVLDAPVDEALNAVSNSPSAAGPAQAKARKPAVKTDKAGKPMDMLRVVAASGGLNRAAWAKQGIDPAEFTRRAGFHYVFRKQGGMTPSDLREFMQQEGYLQADHPDRPAEVDDNDAIDLLDRAFRGGEEIFSPDQQEAVARWQEAERARRDQEQAEWEAEHGRDEFSDWLDSEPASDDLADADDLYRLLSRAYELGATDKEFNSALHSGIAEARALVDRLENGNGDTAESTGSDRPQSEVGGRAAPGEGSGRVSEPEPEPSGFRLDAGQAGAEAREVTAPAQQGGLFGAPTAREQVADAERRRDAERDGKAGTGRTDMLAGDGELFAGDRPEQADIEKPPASQGKETPAILPKGEADATQGKAADPHAGFPQSIVDGLGSFGYTLEGNQIVSPKGKNTGVTLSMKGGRAMARSRDGKLLWSGKPERIGDFPASYWHAERVKAGGPLFSRPDSAEDAEYLDAVKRGDMEAAQRMVNEAAERAGYRSESDFRMNHRSPNHEDDVSLADVRDTDLVPSDYWTHPERYQADPRERAAFHDVSRMFRQMDTRAAKDENPRLATITVYRAVPKGVKEGRIRNGDWVTPSESYARDEGASIPGGFNILRQVVSAKNLWWDGNSIAELGYDDGNGYAYRNTKNNLKLLDAVTRDDEGNVIPLSKRFNSRKDDVRYSAQGNRSRSGMKQNAVQRVVDGITSSWGSNAPKVVVLASAEDYPARMKSDPGYRSSEGAYDHATGTVYLVAENLSSPRRAQQVLAHEAVGHYGVESIVGPEAWAKIRQTLETMKASGRHDELFAEINRRYRGVNSDIAVREAVAVMAERGIHNSVVDRAITALRRFLRSLGFDMTFSEAELRQLLVAASRYVRDGARPQQSAEQVRAASMAFSRTDIDPKREVPVVGMVGGVLGDPKRDLKGMRNEARDYLKRLRDTGLKMTNDDTGWKIGLSKASIGELTNFDVGKMNMLLALPRITKVAVLANSNFNVEGKGEGIKAFHMLYAPVRVNDELRVVRLVVREDVNGHFAYDFQRSDVLGKVNPATVRTPAPKAGAKQNTGFIGATESARFSAPIAGARQKPGFTSMTVAQLREAVNAVDRPGWDWSRPGDQFRTDARGNRYLHRGDNRFMQRGEQWYLDDGEAPADYRTLAEAQAAAERTGGQVLADPNEGDRRTWSVVLPDGAGMSQEASSSLFSQPDTEGRDGATRRARAGERMQKILNGVSDAAPGRREIPEDWDAAQQSAARKFATFAPKEKLGDKFDRVKSQAAAKLVQRVFDQFRPLKSLSPTAFMQAHLSKGTDGALEASFKYGAPVLRDGAFAIDTRDGGVQGALSRLQGDHERFLMWMVGNRAERLLAEGREQLFDKSEIAGMKRFSEGTLPDGTRRIDAYRQAQREINRYNNAFLDIAEKAGLVNAESRKVWQDEFYIPFYREMENGPDVGPGQVGLLRQRVIERLAGGNDVLGDPLENMMANWSHMLTASMRNMAANAALEQGVVAGIAKRLEGPEKGSVWSMRNGKEEYWKVSDPMVLEALEALNFTGYDNPLMKAAGKFKRALTIGVTASPSFRVRNMLRDSLSALGTAEVGYNPLKNMADGWKATAEDSDTFLNLMAGGGSVRFGSFNDGDQAAGAKRLIAMGVKENQILDTKEKVVNFARRLFDQWQEVGDRAETINRAVIYDRAIAAGKSHLEASYEARDLMNFTSMGSASAVRALSQVLPFFNARMQGMDRLGRGVKANPRRFAAVAGVVAMSSALLFLLNADDDDYKALPDYVRDTYWPIKMGGKWVYLPKPFEIGALGTIVERMTELAVAGNDYQAKDFANTLVSVLSGQLAMNPVPQIVRPVTEAAFNYDMFRSAPIDTMGQQNLMAQDRYTARTSAPAVAAGKLTGISPQRLEHMVEGYFGWLGIQALNAGDWMMRDAMGLPSNPNRDVSRSNNLFVIGDFVKEVGTTPSKYLTRFYDMQGQIDQIYASASAARKAGQVDRSLELLQDPKLRMRPAFQNADKEITKLNQTIRAITANQELSAQEKNDRLINLNQRRALVAERVDRLARENGVL